MGAVNFQLKQRGKNLTDAYNRACENAREERGHQDGYNGTISTTHGVRDMTSDFKRSGLSLQDYINKNEDGGGKWGSAWAVCVKEAKTNTNKIKSKVEHIVTKGTKKWVLYYVVTSMNGEIGAKKTKGEAVKIARAHTEETKQRTFILMEKRLEGVSNRVAQVEYKQSTTECDGEYVLWGLAAE